jgi:hypothetical protein
MNRYHVPTKSSLDTIILGIVSSELNHSFCRPIVMTHYKAIIEALECLGGEGTIKEIDQLISVAYPDRWKDSGTALADMVPVYLGGNQSSSVRDEYRILQKVSRGTYRLIYK